MIVQNQHSRHDAYERNKNKADRLREAKCGLGSHHWRALREEGSVFRFLAASKLSPFYSFSALASFSHNLYPGTEMPAPNPPISRGQNIETTTEMSILVTKISSV